MPDGRSRVLLAVATAGYTFLALPTSATASCAQSSPCANSTGTVCVAVYWDVNGNAIRDPNEIFLANVPINISTHTKEAGIADLDGETYSNSPKCFTVTAGDYKVAVGGQGPMQYTWNSQPETLITVQAGYFYNLEFAASGGSLSRGPSGPSIDWNQVFSVLGIIIFFIVMPLMILSLVIMNAMTLRLLQATLPAFKAFSSEAKNEKSSVADEPIALPEPVRVSQPAALRKRSPSRRKQLVKPSKPRRTRRG